MNVLFISISSLPHISEHSISLDLLHEFQKNGHNVFVVCSIEKKDDVETFIQEEAGCQVLRVKIGNNKNAGIIEKGLTTVFLPRRYIAAIKKYYNDVKFDLVLYPTPPVTQVSTVKFIKKRDDAKAYLLLKDIFPQNAVDLGLMTKTGIKGILYSYFRWQEKQLYAISDYIGCMSQANVDYVLHHNSEIVPNKIEILPNSITVIDMRLEEKEKKSIRQKYGLPIGSKIFIYGGNLGKPQNVQFIIECLRSQQDKQDRYFVIVGDGTDYHLIDEYVKSNGQKNITLLKKLEKKEYDKLVSSCDYGMIFLDYRFSIPNYPSRLLGYLQAGLPVLSCTDVNTDIGRFLEEENIGWSCTSDSVENFCLCIEKVMSDSGRITSEHVFECLKKKYSVEDSYNIIISRLGAKNGF